MAKKTKGPLYNDALKTRTATVTFTVEIRPGFTDDEVQAAIEARLDANMYRTGPLADVLCVTVR